MITALRKFAYLAFFALPAFAFAQVQNEDVSTLWSHIVANIVNPIIELLAAGAFVVFIWGVVQFIISLQGGDIVSGSEAKSNPGIGAGKQHMIWGIIGLVIIFGAKAIISILQNTLGL